jgi:hypothetical protein
MAIYYIFLPSCNSSWEGKQEGGRYLRSVAANSKRQAVREFLDQVPGRRFWLVGSRRRPKVVARHEKKVSERARNAVIWQQTHAMAGNGHIYLDEYPIGCQITRRSQPSLERWPVSIGPFSSFHEAEEFAEMAF